MKKGIFLLTLIFILGCGATVFAAKTFDVDGNSDVAGFIGDFKTSKNVEIHVLGAAQTYAARSGHLNGNREFGSASNDPKLYWTAKTTGTQVSDPTASDSGEFSGWSAL